MDAAVPAAARPIPPASAAWPGRIASAARAARLRLGPAGAGRSTGSAGWTTSIVGSTTGATSAAPQIEAAFRAHSMESKPSGWGGTKTENRSSYSRRQIGHSGMPAEV
jgi:hypothetical protein